MPLNPIRAWRRRLAIRRAYIVVFASPEGQMVLHDILARGGMLEKSFVAGDPAGTAFNDGKRQLALEILDELSWTEGHIRKLADQMSAERLRAAEDATDMETNL